LLGYRRRGKDSLFDGLAWAGRYLGCGLVLTEDPSPTLRSGQTASISLDRLGNTSNYKQSGPRSIAQGQEADETGKPADNRIETQSAHQVLLLPLSFPPSGNFKLIRVTRWSPATSRNSESIQASRANWFEMVSLGSVDLRVTDRLIYWYLYIIGSRRSAEY
jgi:hypothetical protein